MSILKGDIFEIYVSQSDTFVSNLEILEYQKTVTFETQVSLFISKVFIGRLCQNDLLLV